jgi:diguanylate cyclase
MLGQVGMEIGLDGVDAKVLHGLFEDASDDIVIRLDNRGFVAQASANIVQIGLDFTARLLPPHITDLTERDHAAYLGSQVSGVLAGHPLVGWVEFPIITCDEHHQNSFQRHRHDAACRRWYALSLRPLLRQSGDAEGAVGLLRSVQQVRNLEGELHARAVTDPLTGLANRQAFCASLRRVLARGGGPMVAMLGVDGMRALLLRYGQRTADEVLWGFAKFLEAMALPGFEVAQLDGERFGVLLGNGNGNGNGNGDEAAAHRWCEEVVSTFATLASPILATGMKLSASAGLARTQCTVDWTLREAELGLVLARAGGGGQVMLGTIPRAGLAATSGLGATHG